MVGNLAWLPDEQTERRRLFLPKSFGNERVDDLRVLRGIIFTKRNGLRWYDPYGDYGNKRPSTSAELRSDMGVFARMVLGVAS